MSSKLPRRTFLTGRLGALLAGWLGRSQAHGSPKTTPGPTVPTALAGKPVTLRCEDPNCTPRVYTACLPDGVILNANIGLITGTISP